MVTTNSVFVIARQRLRGAAVREVFIGAGTAPIFQSAKRVMRNSGELLITIPTMSPHLTFSSINRLSSFATSSTKS